MWMTAYTRMAITTQLIGQGFFSAGFSGVGFMQNGLAGKRPGAMLNTIRIHPLDLR